MPPFVDTNILLRHLLQDHADHSPRAPLYLARIERGEVELLLTDTVVFETVFTLERLYGLSRQAIRDGLLPVIGLPGIRTIGVRGFDSVFDLHVGSRLSFADAYHAILAVELGSAEILSVDRGFDRVPGLRRVEP